MNKTEIKNHIAYVCDAGTQRVLSKLVNNASIVAETGITSELVYLPYIIRGNARVSTSWYGTDNKGRIVVTGDRKYLDFIQRECFAKNEVTDDLRFRYVVDGVDVLVAVVDYYDFVDVHLSALTLRGCAAPLAYGRQK